MEASARQRVPEDGPAGPVGDPGRETSRADHGSAAAMSRPAGAVGDQRISGRPGGHRGLRVRSLLRRAWPAGAALSSGVLLTAAFPSVGWWPAAPLAVAVITIAIWQPSSPRPLRRGAILGFLAGAAFFGVLLFWLHVIGPDAWLVLAFVEALYFAPLGAAIAAVARLPGAPVWAACLWVADEAVRDRLPLGGFTWGRLAFSQSASPFTRYVALGGAPLLTFVIALTGTLLATVVVGAGMPRVRAATLRLAAAAGVIGLAAIGPVIPLPHTNGRAVTAAIVQGNVPRLGLNFLGQRATVLHNHVDAMRKLAALVRMGRLPRPDVVILPENSSDLDPYRDPAAYTLINSAVRDIGVPTLVGAMHYTSDRRHLENRGIVWSPKTGPGAFYIKRHPVPLGEYVPLRSVLTKFIKRFHLVPYDQVAGHRPGVLRLGPVTIGDVICFEVSYDEIVREAVTHGGDAIVVQTNNADFGRTGQPAQQLAISRLRAVEHDRPVLVAATSGISAIISADGSVLAQSRQFTQAILVRHIRGSAALTLADRLGELPEWVLGVTGTCAAAAGIWLAGRQQKVRKKL